MTQKLQFQRAWQILGITGLLVVCIFSLSKISQPLAVDYADKWTHWIVWMFMMNWFLAAWPDAKTRSFLLLLLTGSVLELLQGYLPWRYMELNDVLANLAGLVSGWLLMYTPIQRLLPRFDRFLANRLDPPPV